MKTTRELINDINRRITADRQAWERELRRRQLRDLGLLALRAIAALSLMFGLFRLLTV